VEKQKLTCLVLLDDTVAGGHPATPRRRISCRGYQGEVANQRSRRCSPKATSQKFAAIR